MTIARSRHRPDLMWRVAVWAAMRRGWSSRGSKRDECGTDPAGTSRGSRFAFQGATAAPVTPSGRGSGSHTRGGGSCAGRTRLNPKENGSEAAELERQLRKLIAGQDEAIREIVNVYQLHLAGLAAPQRPIGAMLFLGPTGTGKTRMVEALAEALVGSRAPSSRSMRGVPAQPRDCETRRFASRLSGPSRNAPAAEPGDADAVSHRPGEAQLRAVR